MKAGPLPSALLSPASSGFRVRLDWGAYWQAFKEAHGKDPVPWRGRLLFRDGWTYSSTDPAGPEWPPPMDAEELRRVQVVYWKTRRAIVRAERDRLRDMVAGLKALQANKSVTLQQRTIILDDDTGRPKLLKVDVDTRAIEEGRLQWLVDDVLECDQRLEELGVMV